MKPAYVSRLGHRAAWMLGSALFFVQTAAQACPGCKQNTDGVNAPPLNGDSIGFGLSIFFMIFMITAIIGGLGFMTYRACQALAARERALDAEEAMSSGNQGGSMQPRPA